MSDAKKMLNELAYTHLVPKDEQGRELVAVVRCKDCKRARACKDETEIFCDLIAAYMGLDDYCSYGERKDNEPA